MNIHMKHLESLSLSLALITGVFLPVNFIGANMNDTDYYLVTDQS